jgi:hypothetical protein
VNLRTFRFLCLCSGAQLIVGCGTNATDPAAATGQQDTADAESASDMVSSADSVSDVENTADAEDTADTATTPDTLVSTDVVSPSDITGGTTSGLPVPDGKPDIKFRPNPNGFQFQNYGGDPGIVNMAPRDVRRLFGDQACAIAKPDGDCTLTPPGQQWLDQNNKSMSGGHCEGFAALSLLFYQNKLKVADYGAESTYALALASNEKLQQEIAMWFSTQATEPTTKDAIRGKSPSEIVKILTDTFSKGTESYTIGIYKPEFKEGHAITPYAIKDNGGGLIDIMVYDNNFPNEERAINVDTNANTWKYVAAADPKEAASLYQGDANTKTLDLTPTSSRLVQQVCPFCGDVATSTGGGATLGSVKGAAVSYRTITLSAGKADLLIATPDGKRVGYEGGKFVNEITGADAVPMKSAEPWLVEPDPSYRLPLGMEHKITIDGTALTAASPADVVAVAPGYSLGVLGIQLDPGQKDTVTFSADNKEIHYITTSSESPDFELGVTLDGADWRFLIATASESGGQDVQITLDLVKGTVSVQVKSTDGSSSFAMEIHRIDDVGDQVFTHEGTALASTDTIVINYGTWKGNGSPMSVGTDKGGDGSIDSTEDATDSK